MFDSCLLCMFSSLDFWQPYPISSVLPLCCALTSRPPQSTVAFWHHHSSWCFRPFLDFPSQQFFPLCGHDGVCCHFPMHYDFALFPTASRLPSWNDHQSQNQWEMLSAIINLLRCSAKYDLEARGHTRLLIRLSSGTITAGCVASLWRCLALWSVRN